jgi:hypothetical protein
MAQSLSSIRKQIADKVAAITGFKESNHTPDYFGRTENTIANKAFAVGVSSSTGIDERQRRAVGVYMSTPMIVTFAYRLRPLDVYPTDYDLALDTEQEVIQGILGAYITDNAFTIRYVQSQRNVTDSQEYIIISLTFNILHTI